MMGRERARPANPDDVAILVYFRGRVDRRQAIGDRILRIKTLEAMLDLVLDGPEAIALPPRASPHRMFDPPAAG